MYFRLILSQVIFDTTIKMAALEPDSQCDVGPKIHNQDQRYR